MCDCDANNLTRKDLLCIASTCADAGIPAGSELAELNEADGFDTRVVEEIASFQELSAVQVNGNGFNISDELIQNLYSLLDQYYSEDTSEDQRKTLMKSFHDLLGSGENKLSIWILKRVCSAYLYRIMYSS